MPASQCLVSIITVTFNAGRSVRTTIDSIQAQTFRDFEHIVVDGQSTDDTLEIVQGYGDRISRLVSEPDRGIYDAMNKGLALAQGEWVMFLNAGDYFCSSDSLASVQPLLGGTADILYSDVVCDYGAFRKVMRTPAERDFQRTLSHGMPVCHNAMLFRTARHRQCPYDLSYRIAADYDVIWRLVRQGATASKISRPIVAIETGQGISYRKQAVALQEHLAVMKSQDVGMRALARGRLNILKALVSAVVKRLLPRACVSFVVKVKG